MESNTQSATKKSFNPLIIIVIVVATVILALPVYLNSKKSNSTSEEVKTSAPVTVDAVKTITLGEIAKHADKTDCWMAIEGNVYDVSAFVPKHPGEDAILLGCGKDATEMFNKRPNDGTSHSDRARTQLANFLIGKLSK